MQLATQPVWLILQFTPLVYIAFHGTGELTAWSGFTGAEGNRDGSIGLPQFGAAGSMLMSLLPQIGEQVDYLRFARPATGLPEGQSKNSLFNLREQLRAHRYGLLSRLWRADLLALLHVGSTLPRHL